MFADAIVLVDESREGLNAKIEVWKENLEYKEFKIIRMKTEYFLQDY